MEPLGTFAPFVAPRVGNALGIFAICAATALLELSRTLAEAYRGRWFAGNGRDVFHAAAAGVFAAAVFLIGLPPALACLAAASLLLLPLLFLDSLPARRDARIVFLYGLMALSAAPPVLAPRWIVDTANLVARWLFPH